MTQLRVSHLSDPRQIASGLNGVLRRTDPIDVSSDQLSLTVDRALSVAGGITASADLGAVNATLTGNLVAVNVNVSGVYQVAGVQVVGARSTGWVADTGTAEKTAHATYTAPTISNPPTQAEVQAIANAVQSVTRGQKAIKDALITHGLLGA